ncbi:MAG: PQQ-binding-like beta-propeller repeat protein [Pirellula sp.]|jgi:outer membrane protein assembly factor BamB
MKSSIARYLLPLATCLVAVVFAPCVSQGQINDSAIAPAGLEIQWENSLGGAGLARGEQNLVIWPHKSERREYVDVYVGNRLIERIDGRQIDKAAVDRLILEGKPLRPTPVLGLSGAKAKAEKLVSTYKILGRNATVKTFSEPVIYIVAVATNGIVSAIDGESGEVLWQSSVPNPDLPILGPGVSDDYVTVVNGNRFYAMELKTGNLVNSARLSFTPTGTPVPLKTRIMVPSIGGRIIGYDMEKPVIEPVILRAGTENRNGTTMSPDGDFLAWASDTSLFLIHNENVPKMWSRVNAGGLVGSRPVATSKGFVFVGNFGTVIHASTNRTGSYQWRANLAMPTSRSPIVARDHVLVLSDDGRLEALDLETGNRAWPTMAPNINRLLGVGKETVYVRDSGGMLATHKLSDGSLVARTNCLLQGVIPNSITDRLFVVTRDGHLTCMREKGAVMPTMYNTVSNDESDSSKSTSKPAAGATANPDSNADDIFGAEPKGAAPAGNDKDPFDPF